MRHCCRTFADGDTFRADLLFEEELVAAVDFKVESKAVRGLSRWFCGGGEWVELEEAIYLLDVVDRILHFEVEFFAQS